MVIRGIFVSLVFLTSMEMTKTRKILQILSVSPIF